MSHVKMLRPGVFNSYKLLLIGFCLFLLKPNTCNGLKFNHSELTDGLLIKAEIPSYVDNFLDFYRKSENGSAWLAENLLHGISRKCAVHVAEWVIRLKNPTWENMFSEENTWALQRK